MVYYTFSMLVEAEQLSKTIGAKDLFTDLSLMVGEGEKIALIGRNGQGKTTLLKMISGEDTDFGGTVRSRKNMRVTLTKQEHITDTSLSPLTYILGSVPGYMEDEKILTDFENGLLTDIRRYSDALERFSGNGYYYIKDLILGTLAGLGIDGSTANAPLGSLSGGEKRYVELVRMMYSKSDLFLVDEPTNHMDYIGKEEFIKWMGSEENSVLVVTHDRDVLKRVDKIIELKDKRLTVFNGNYDRYLEQNTNQTTNSVKLYQNQLNQLRKAKKLVEWGNQMRAKSKEWKIRYDHWLRDYEKLKAETVKPSFWIDQESTEMLDQDVMASYKKFREKNIKIATDTGKDRANQLVELRGLSLGYETPLFSGIHLSMRNDDRVFVKGRNGAGKSTLVRTIMATYRNERPAATLFAGQIKLGPTIRIGEYEQEIAPKYLGMTLEDAIKITYEESGAPIPDVRLKSLLSQYLFDPMLDARQRIANLSGGQKARFQIIKMLATKPNLLILDEPTNHLDLPSIEELENSLASFPGGILYISHDTYFIERMGGETIEI